MKKPTMMVKPTHNNIRCRKRYAYYLMNAEWQCSFKKDLSPFWPLYLYAKGEINALHCAVPLQIYAILPELNQACLMQAYQDQRFGH